MNWSHYECEGQMSIFDLLEKEPEQIQVPEIVPKVDFEEILKKGFISYGTGFANGRVRVHRILEGYASDKDKIAAIKKEFGMGGSYTRPKVNAVHKIDTMGNGITIGWSDAEGVYEETLPWTQVYKYLVKWDTAGEYCNIRFYPEAFKIEKHYFCNGRMYLKIAKNSGIYYLPGMKDKNLYLVYYRDEKDHYDFVSVTKAKSEKLDLTDDEMSIIQRIMLDYGWSFHGHGGIWNVFKERTM